MKKNEIKGIVDGGSTEMRGEYTSIGWKIIVSNVQGNFNEVRYHTMRSFKENTSTNIAIFSTKNSSGTIYNPTAKYVHRSTVGVPISEAGRSPPAMYQR